MSLFYGPLLDPLPHLRLTQAARPSALLSDRRPTGAQCCSAPLQHPGCATKEKQSCPAPTGPQRGAGFRLHSRRGLCSKEPPQGAPILCSPRARERVVFHTCERLVKICAGTDQKRRSACLQNMLIVMTFICISDLFPCFFHYITETNQAIT